MSRKSKKLKRRRAIIVIVFIFILLFLSIFYIRGMTQNNDGNIGNKDNNNVEQNQDKNNKGIVEIKVSPEKYTAYSGEIIDLNMFNVVGVSKKGEENTLSEKIEFSVSNDIFNIEDNNLVISEDAITADKGVLSIKCNGQSKDVEIEIINNLKNTINENAVITNPSAYDMIVNKTRNLSKDYVPNDLVKLDDVPTVLQNPEINQLRKAAYDALKELFSKAKEEKSFALYARSGYRSYGTQIDLYNSYVAKHGQSDADTFSAKAGQSEHQSGLAIDITCEAMKFQLDYTFFDTEEGKWVAENAHRFGYIIRYPKGKEDITGYQYEPWHLRYVGETLAKEIYESQLTMEEYFERLE